MHSERDEALYRAGLRGMGVLLAHPATTNLELTAYPSGYPFSYSVPSTFPAWHAYGTRALDMGVSTSCVPEQAQRFDTRLGKDDSRGPPRPRGPSRVDTSMLTGPRAAGAVASGELC